jgi:hypothetical protein
MNRARKVFLQFAPVALLLFTAAGLTGCYDDYEAGYEVDPASYPAPAYVATVAPVYYEGRPAYWYGNRWYFRDGGGRWGYYRSEPRYLYQYRGRYGYGGRWGGGYRGYRRR